MSFSPSQYQLSKKFNTTSVICYTLFGIVIAILYGKLYLTISHYLPIVLLNIILSFITIFVLSLIANILAKKAKIRNNTVKFLMAFLICLFAYYSNICAFEVKLYPWLDLSYIDLFLLPNIVYDIMFYDILPNHEIGFTKELYSVAISGVFLNIIYLVELGIFLLPALIVVNIKYYFCENCQKWYENTIFYSFSDETLESNISKSINGNYVYALSQITLYADIEALISQLNSSNDDVFIIKYLHFRCPGCQQKSIINIEKNILKIKRGEEEHGFIPAPAFNGTLVKDTYIDNRTDALFASQTGT